MRSEVIDLLQATNKWNVVSCVPPAPGCDAFFIFPFGADPLPGMTVIRLPNGVTTWDAAKMYLESVAPSPLAARAIPTAVELGSGEFRWFGRLQVEGLQKCIGLVNGDSPAVTFLDFVRCLCS